MYIFQKYVLGCGTCKQGRRQKVRSSEWVNKKKEKKNQSYHVNKNLEIITGRGNILEFVVMQQWMLKSARSTSLVWRLGSWARTLLGWPARRDSFRLCSHHIWFYNKASFLLKVYSCTVTGAVVDAVFLSFLQDPSNISSCVWLESLVAGYGCQSQWSLTNTIRQTTLVHIKQWCWTTEY